MATKKTRAKAWRFVTGLDSVFIIEMQCSNRDITDKHLIYGCANSNMNEACRLYTVT